LVFLISAISLLNPQLSAQITGELRGSVEDASGATITSAVVRATGTETALSRKTQTDDSGRFSFALLPVGNYKLTVEASGFQATTTQAEVRAGEVVTARLQLEVGPVTESITVNDAVTPLSAEAAQLQETIFGAPIQNLPVQRNPNLFALTSPGVVPVVPNLGFLGSGSFTSNGGRGRGVNATVDGIVSTDAVTTGTAGPLGTLTVSQLQEVKIITNNFNAEYGRNASAQLVYVTRSGGNQPHGEFYDYLQNDKLNARPWFDRTGRRNVVRQNLYGLAIGGPVQLPKLYDGRNKTFFFGTYEGQKRRGLGDVRIAQVPTPAMLAQVTDPTARALLDMYKLPEAQTITPSFGQTAQSAPDAIDSYQASVRGDHRISDRDTLWGRYSRFVQTAVSPALTFSSSNIPGFGPKVATVAQQATLAETHVFSASLVNEFRAAFGRSVPDFAPDSPYPLGPRVSFQNAAVNPFGMSEGYPQGRLQNTFQYSDTLSWTRGRHVVKLGADIHRLQVRSYAETFQRPTLLFADWPSFAQGRLARYQQRFGTSVRGNRVWNHFFFAQDDWRVTRNLTLNLGMRMEVAGGVTEVNGIITNLDLDCREPMGAAGVGPLGCLRNGEPSFHTNYNWGPRAGFAWTPTDSRRWVVRGGYGIAYDFVYLSPINNQRFLPPFNFTATLTAFDEQNSLARLVAGTALIQEQGKASVGKLSETARNFGNVNPAIDEGLANPQVQQWNFGVERDLGAGWIAKASYVGTKGTFLTRGRPINLIAAPPAPATSVADETARLPQFMAANQQATGSATAPSNRIDPRFNEVHLVESSANSVYHSLQVEVDKRFSRSYLLRGAYTIAKSLDDVSDAQNVMAFDSALQQNPRDNRDNRARSAFDIPQRLVIMHQWEPEWGRGSSGLVRHLIGGWGFSGITSFRAGFPLTLEASARRTISALTLVGIANGPVRPNAAGPVTFQPAPAGSPDAPQGTVNPDGVQAISSYAAALGLSQPLLGNFGSLGRNMNRINGEKNFDWNVYKKFPLSETAFLQVRAEFYNAFNNTAFEGVNRNITNAAFGQYTAVGQPARFMQVGARVVF
jgi:hypothetical protein